MEIRFTSYDDKFDEIVIYSLIDNNKIYGFPDPLYPILEVRERMAPRREFVMVSETDLFKYPDCELQQINPSFYDGVIHVNKLFKPHEFTVRLLQNTTEFMNIWGDLYLTRGVFRCTVITDWGTTNVFPVVMTELDEFKMEMKFMNPEARVQTSQNTLYVFNYESIAARLFPALSMYPGASTYPYIERTVNADGNESIYVASPSTAVLTFYNSNSAEVDVRIDGVTLNNYLVTLTGSFIMPHNSKYVVDYNNNIIKFYPNADEVDYDILASVSDTNWDQLRTTNWIDLEYTPLIDPAGEPMDGTITLTVESEGRYNVVS